MFSPVLQVPAKVLAGLISSKLVLHPLIGLASLLAALHAGLLPADTDPLMLLVMLLVWCPPTAVLTHSLATMLQVGGASTGLVRARTLKAHGIFIWQEQLCRYYGSSMRMPLCVPARVRPRLVQLWP